MQKEQSTFRGQRLAVSVPVPVRKSARLVSCQLDSEHKRPSFAARIGKAVVPALSTAILATAIAFAPAADAMQSYLLNGGVGAAQAEIAVEADEPAVLSPEERARKLGELLRKKREEQEAILAVQRAEAEQMAAARAAEDEAARRFAEERIRSEKLFVKPELKPSNVVKEASAPAAKETKNGEKAKRGGLPLFVSQFGVLAAFGGGIATLFLVPEEKWRVVEEKMEGVKDMVLPIVDEVVVPFVEMTIEKTKEFAEVAQPYAEKAMEVAIPAAEAAFEAAKPVAEAAMEAARPMADQAMEKVKEITDPIVSQVGDRFDQVKEAAGPVMTQVGEVAGTVKEIAGPMVGTVQEKAKEVMRELEGNPKPKA